MLIVEDADDEIPATLAAMEEVVLFLSHIDMPTLVAYQQEQSTPNSYDDDTVYFNKALWDVECHGDDDFCDPGYGFDTVLVNGIREPTLDLTTGVWYRWRVVFASVEEYLNVGFSDTSSCEMQLIAKCVLLDRRRCARQVV